MAAPVVQDLNELINTYKTALQPQQQIYDTQITQNDTSGQQQQQGLEATKNTAFKGITQQANDRGAYFSGFTPDAQATYTAGTYLPALAQLQATIANTRGQLLGKKAELDTTANTSALTTQQQQKSDLQKWQDAQEAAARAAAEADKQRAFEASQTSAKLAADRANTQLQVSASRAASAKPDISGIVNNIGGFLQGKVGKDGKVSPSTFQSGRQQWVAAGGDPNAYTQAFYGYINTSHGKDYGL